MWWIYFFLFVMLIAAPIVVIQAFRREDRKPSLLAAIAVLVVALMPIGYFSYPVALAQSQKAAVGGFIQTLNGPLVSYDVDEIPCEKDGRCVHVDPYCDPEIHTEDIKDEEGNVIGQRRWTEYHSCPFMTHEYTFTVEDIFGNVYTIGANWFAESPQEWSSFGTLVNRSGAGNVPRGVPPKWQQYKDRLERGDAPAITVRVTYDNFIVGSEDEAYRGAADDIEVLMEAGLLPPHTANIENPIYDHFRADKVLFVGMEPPANYDVWQDTLQQGNSGIGMERHADLHIVAIRASAIPAGISPEDYTAALVAHWVSDYGKNAFPKNAIALILAVNDDATGILWARSATGMQDGNGEMNRAFMFRLSNQNPPLPFDPHALLGTTTASVDFVNDEPEVTFSIGDGPVIEIIMQHFVRVCMRCDDEGEEGQAGYTDLQDLIPISTEWTIGAIVGILLIGAILTVLTIWLYSWITLAPVRYLAQPNRDDNRYNY